MQGGYREEHTPMLRSRHGNDLRDLDVGGGQTPLRVCMHARSQERWAGTDHPSLDHDRDQQHAYRHAAQCQICLVLFFTRQWRVVTSSAVLIVVVCAVSSRGFDVDSLDGTVKGGGETDDEADATCAWGRGAGIVVIFV